jgi:hypothetical protein
MTQSLSLLPLQKEWFFHWDHAPIAIAPFLKPWFADHSIAHLCTQLVTRLCFCGFILVLEGEGGAEGLSLDKDNLTETFIVVTTTIAADEFATAIRQ